MKNYWGSGKVQDDLIRRLYLIARSDSRVRIH